MKLGGVWVGLGLGDSSDEVQKIKDFITRKWDRFDQKVTPGPLFDEALTEIILELQGIYHGQGKLHAPNGIVDFDTKVAMGFHKPPPPILPTLFTVCGTGVPWWVGPDADVARAVADKYYWQPVGYPAKPFPMGGSVTAGRAELVNQINLHPGPFSLIGYSQGAIVTGECWEYDLKPDNGVLHHRKNDVMKAVAYGNPMRQAGKVYADQGGALPAADSHGIADRLMEDTPDWWRNYAHKGDLYTDCAGEAGENKTAIYKIVMGARMFSGPDSLLSQVLEVLGVKHDSGQLFEIMGIFTAIMDAGMFAIKGTGPHVNYDIRPGIDYLRN